MRKPPADRLGFEDAAFLNFERPEFPYNVGSVGIFEGAIPFQKYVQHVETRIQLVPRYCQRVVTVPFNVAQPTWQTTPTSMYTTTSSVRGCRSRRTMRNSLASPGSSSPRSSTAAGRCGRCAWSKG
jgi:hypothetical protein